MSLKCVAANAVLSTFWRIGSRRYWRSLENVEAGQGEYLRTLLRNNRDTAFGKTHQFDRISSVREFRERVPVATYEDLESYIDRIRAGEECVLTREAVTKLTPTSGSTGATKLIPYTHALRKEFNAGLAPWLWDLSRNCPDVRKGTAYWAISPMAADTDRGQESRVPIGFEEDASYFGAAEKYLIDATMAVPAELAKIQSIELSRYLTLMHLLSSKELRIISVWSPTFLTLLLAYFKDNQESLVRDVHNATCSLFEGSPAKDYMARFNPNPARAEELEGLLDAWHRGAIREPWGSIWPKLRVISCWKDGWAERFAEEVESQFPTVHIQGKGLLATEAFISFPLWREGEEAQCPLAVTCHFYEFEDCSNGEMRLAHELEQGETYAVIVTTGGGLYRYRLGDKVRVTGFAANAPCLTFVGREKGVSDIFGEKLHEEHVQKAVDTCLDRFGISTSLVFLAPEISEEASRYVLFFVDDGGTIDAQELPDLLDNELRKNFHYDYCRRLGQLARVGVCALGEGATEVYMKEKAIRGQMGVSKIPVLEQMRNWREVFKDARR